MSEYFFGLDSGHMPKRADAVAKRHGAWLNNHTDPGCGCGYGCARECPARQRHWFGTDNRGEPHNSATARAVMAEIQAENIKPKRRK